MSGHSKWSTIKRQKGATDVKRSMTFTKLANAITLAAKSAGTDSSTNPRLRVILDAARAANMPKDNLQRAIDRGLGKLPGQIIEEVLYEGFGPQKVSYIVEAVTDNKLRTLQEIRNLFERAGGSLGSSGSALYMFKQIGELKINSKGLGKDTEMLELIDLGAEDVEDFEDQEGVKYLVYIPISELNTMSNNITQKGFTIESAEIIYLPTITVEVKDSVSIKKVLEFTEKLEEHDDVQKVFSNFEIPDELI